MSDQEIVDFPVIEDIAEEKEISAKEESEVALEEAIAATNKPEVKKESSLDKKPLRWYVIQAFSGYEQRVATTLRERIVIHGMEDDFGEVLVPKEKVKEIKDGKKRESERKFFPGYVLVLLGNGAVRL